MITKAFSSKKEVKLFKDQYSNGEVDTEVISNLLQPFYRDKFPELASYCDFWWPEDQTKFGLIGVLQLMIVQHGAQALEESFGKYDFSFEGNRKYKNYVLSSEGLTIVAPAKREVVIPEGGESKDLREKLVRFENEFCQFVVDYMYKHYNEMEDFRKDSLDKLKVAGIINEENKINFEYYNKAVKKNKMK